ncbi:uncharacterized protein LOC118508797 [Anopheles stephensi]|nr:uncharacterized protein LOC118508797 [Anopheles stephensi]
MQQSRVALLLSLTLSQVLVVFCASEAKFGSLVTFGTKQASLKQCYSTTLKANVFSLVPITRVVTFTPQMPVRYITVASKTSGTLSARIVQGGINMDSARPISVALASDYGGRLNAEINAYCA